MKKIFQTWKYQIQTVLSIQGLLKIAEGKEQCSEPIMVTGTDESANKQYITHVEKTENWDCYNKETKAQITLTLSDEPLNGVIHAGSASDAWDKLNYCYEG